MRKKGFTFVELAIVLVIIGIIMGMLIKGRSLIETARLKSEIRKIERIQASVAGWFSKTSGGMEAMDAFPLVSESDLTQLAFSALPDLSKLETTHPYGLWTMYRGKLSADNKTAKIDAAGINVILRAGATTPRFACNIEFMLDDRDFLNGNGRSEITAVIGNADVGFQPCDNWADIVENKKFDYRIF
jgi:prepilin-type N-terminal cleavage/methylation domain-containing protein